MRYPGLSFIAVIGIALMICTPARADSVSKTLEKAQAEHTLAVEQARKHLNDAIERQTIVLAEAGDFDALKVLVDQKRGFEDAELLPTAASLADSASLYRTELRKANAAMAAAYEEAIKQYNLKEKSKKAAAVARQLAAFERQVKAADRMGTGAEQTGVDRPVYLSNLEPVKVKTYRSTGWDFGTKGRVGTTNGARISVDGKLSPNGIGMHPPRRDFSHVVYDIGGKFGRFQGAVAINDTSNRSQTAVTFEVRGDGESLWSSTPIRERHRPQDFDIEVTGYRRIELLAHCPGGHTGAHAVWIEPRLYVGARIRIETMPEGLGEAADDESDLPDFDPSQIERPRYANKTKTLARLHSSINGLMVRIGGDGRPYGFSSQIIVTCQRNARAGVSFHRKVGPQMHAALGEAVRAIKLRYPIWEQAKFEVSFSEKYTLKDGGSAGTAFALLLLSVHEGFAIDPAFAVTGDIAVNWKVQPVGAVAAKVRGAGLDKIKYVTIPQSAEKAMGDLIVLHSPVEALGDVQVFAIDTLQDAAALVRTDRAPPIAQAISLFADFQKQLKEHGRSYLSEPKAKKTLKHVIELAPHHLSARYANMIVDGSAPRTLTAMGSLTEISTVTAPFQLMIWTGGVPARGGLPRQVTRTSLDQLRKLTPIVHPNHRELHRHFKAYISAAEACARAKGKRVEATKKRLRAKREALMGEFQKLRTDRKAIEQLLRDGV